MRRLINCQIFFAFQDELTHMEASRSRNCRIYTRIMGLSVSLGASFLFIAIALTPPAIQLSQPVAAPHLNTTATPLLRFTDETFIRGINHSHRERSKRINGLHELFGAGVCALDFNNDGWIDLLFVGGSGAHKYYGKKSWWAKASGHRLYRNSQNGYFEDVSETSKLDDVQQGMGCAAADLDNDGDEDIIITTLGPNYVYENDGNGEFKKSQLGNTSAWSTTASLGDFNNDGLVDIYIANFIDYSHYKPKYETSSGHHVVLDENFRANFFKPQSNSLYINQGNLVFTEQAKALGVANHDGRSVFATWHDINHDGFIDLFVGNREGSFSKLFINQAGQYFEEAIDHKLYPFPKNYHSLTAGDIDGDAVAELIFSGAATQALAVFSLIGQQYEDISTEIIRPSNKPYAYEKFSTAVFDSNGDGKADLLTTSGYMLPDQDSDALSLAQPNLWLININGKLQDSYRSIEHSINRVASSRSLINVDIDNDGDDDVIISNNNDYPQLLINHTPRTQSKNKPDASHYTGFLSSRYSNSVPRLHSAAEQSVIALTFLQFKALMLFENQPASYEQLQASYRAWTREDKLFSLQFMNRIDQKGLLHALIQLALSDQADIAIAAANIVLQNNFDAFVNDIFRLTITSDDDTACKILGIIEHVFIREESFIRQKRALTTALTRQLNAYGNTKGLCAISALAKSRSKRPIKRLSSLATGNNTPIAIAAIQALGELKHKDAAGALQALAFDANKAIALEARAAIQKLNGTPIINKTAKPLPNTRQRTSRSSCNLEAFFDGGALTNRQLSVLLRLCANTDIEHWVTRHADDVAKHYPSWLYNWELDAEKYAILLATFINETAPSGAQIAIGTLARNPPIAISESIVNTLIAHKPNNLSSALLTDIGLNTNLTFSTRLAAAELILATGDDPARPFIKKLKTEFGNK